VGKTGVGGGSVGLGVSEADTGGREAIVVIVGVAVILPLAPRSTSKTIPPSR